MTDKELSRQTIVEQFKGGIDCSQVVLGQWVDELGYNREEVFRIAAAFGGGMFHGDIVGSSAAP